MRLLFFILLTLSSCVFSQKITPTDAARFAKLALDGIPQEYPNKPSNVMVGPESVQSPREMHPAFYGSFDWHSSIHGHWMLIHLLRHVPETPVAAEIEALLDKQLTKKLMIAEAAYFQKPHNKSFERMYGWAWALQLAAELHYWKKTSPTDSRPAKWSAAFQPLEQQIVTMTFDYLPKLNWPIRNGTHTDSGFALGMILDYARQVDHAELEKLIIARAEHFYENDRNYPVSYEPSGHDFFSSGLNEADLMRRILPADDFSKWLDGFFPALRDGKLGNLLTPTEVTDVNDGHLIHLAGLNFCRAWTMAGIASALEPNDPRALLLRKSAKEHLSAGLPYLGTGYEGDHWLATFAVYATAAQ